MPSQHIIFTSVKTRTALLCHCYVRTHTYINIFRRLVREQKLLRWGRAMLRRRHSPQLAWWLECSASRAGNWSFCRGSRQWRQPPPHHTSREPRPWSRRGSRGAPCRSPWEPQTWRGSDWCRDCWAAPEPPRSEPHSRGTPRSHCSYREPIWGTHPGRVPRCRSQWGPCSLPCRVCRSETSAPAWDRLSCSRRCNGARSEGAGSMFPNLRPSSRTWSAPWPSGRRRQGGLAVNMAPPQRTSCWLRPRRHRAPGATTQSPFSSDLDICQRNTNISNEEVNYV